MKWFFHALCFLLTGLSCTGARAQTISSFSPASGHVGTLVTLHGTDLNTVTAVDINGTNCLVLDRTDTALRLLVMPGATTGALSVRGSVTATSAAAFSVTPVALGIAQQGPKLVGTGAVGAAVQQGSAVALSADGTTLAVGAPGDNNGQGDATWVFTRSGTGWTQQGPKLVGTGAVGAAVQQGSAVALSADGATLAVGGPGDNNGGGATWVFKRAGTAWAQHGPKLVGTGAAVNAAVRQGFAVALSADGATLAVGGPGDNGQAGATWVFTRSGSMWAQQGPKLMGTGDVGVTVKQGGAVALSADGATLAVGAPGDNSSGGATWVFTRSGTVWVQQGPKLVGTGAVGSYARQGSAVALSADGTTLAVGGTGDNSAVGATWVYARTGTGWAQHGPKLIGTGSNGPGAGPWYSGVLQGSAVALSADGATLAVGGENDGRQFGATWVYARTGTGWAQHGPKLIGTGAVVAVVGPGGTPIYQGHSVALSADGTTLAVGGYADNNSIGATWVFSTQNSPLAQHGTAGPRARASFFPNPVAEQVSVSGGADAGTLHLLDALGRTQLVRPYRRGEPIDLSSLAPGLYWLRLDQDSPQPLLKR